MTTDLEIVDGPLLIRRVVVGELETNCWIIASAATQRAVVIDPGAEPTGVIDAVADLTVDQVVLTHTHWDHVLGLPEVADALGVPIRAHPDDSAVWPHELEHFIGHGHFDAGTATAALIASDCSLAPPPGVSPWDGHTHAIHDREYIGLDDITIKTIHTPGHTPGGISLQTAGHVFTGDTLFPGGPGLTGWPLSDFDTIIESIQTRLLTLPDDASVHPGHGASTTIGSERPKLDDWRRRGW